ncbi:hypothetical protein B0H14DRAFT_2628709 [Mycena olivaceomarginata]|nr:hypothetical protein B0H14DRAFT_2628709 [Mycena olivaceomarginata]
MHLQYSSVPSTAQHPCKALHAAGAVRDGVQREAADTGESSLRGCTRGDVAGGGDEGEAGNSEVAVHGIQLFGQHPPLRMKCRAEGSGMHVMKMIGDYGASTVYTSCGKRRSTCPRGPGSEPYIAEQFLGNLDAETWRRMGADTETNARCDLLFVLTAGRRGELSEIVQYLLHTLYRACAGDEEPASGLLPTKRATVLLTVRKCAGPTPDLVDSDNTSWHIGSRTCTDPPDLVNSNNTSWHIGSRTVPTPVARAVSPDLVDSGQHLVEDWVQCADSGRLHSVLPICNKHLVEDCGHVPTAVARTVSPDLVDSDNTSWKILRNPVVQARAENVDSDNKRYLGDCGQYFLDHQVDKSNTNWTIGNNRRFLLLLELLPMFEWCPPLLLWPLSEFLSDYVHSNYLPASTPEQIAEVGRLYPEDPAQVLMTYSPMARGPRLTRAANALTLEYKCISAFQGDFQFTGPRRFFLEHASHTQDTWGWLNKRGKDASPLGAFHVGDTQIWFTANTSTTGETVGVDALINFINTLDPNRPAHSSSNSAQPAIFWPKWGNISTPKSAAGSPALLTFTDAGINITAEMFRIQAIGSAKIFVENLVIQWTPAEVSDSVTFFSWPRQEFILSTGEMQIGGRTKKRAPRASTLVVFAIIQTRPLPITNLPLPTTVQFRDCIERDYPLVRSSDFLWRIPRADS